MRGQRQNGIVVKLHFNDDGTIRKLERTKAGVESAVTSDTDEAQETD